MAQATLSDMTHPTVDESDSQQAIDWIVNDSVATAYLNMSNHLAHFDEYDAIEQSEVAL